MRSNKWIHKCGTTNEWSLSLSLSFFPFLSLSLKSIERLFITLPLIANCFKKENVCLVFKLVPDIWNMLICEFFLVLFLFFLLLFYQQIFRVLYRGQWGLFKKRAKTTLVMEGTEQPGFIPGSSNSFTPKWKFSLSTYIFSFC